MQGHANRRGEAPRRSLPAFGIALLLLLAFAAIAYPRGAMAASGFGAFFGALSDCLTTLGGLLVGTAHGDGGTSPLTDVHNGDAMKQINAVWQYLLLGDKMPPPGESAQ